MEQTITMMTEEEAPEVGPNDIVIHLVNPYKCGICDLEFLEKSVFKEHMFAHLEHIKHEHPSSQIVMTITLPPETPGGVTVTRDILQLGEDGSIKQVLQPTNSINMNQVSPLRELEEAGLIKLEHPKVEVAAPKTEPLPRMKPAISTFTGTKMIQQQQQPIDLLAGAAIPIEQTAEVEGLLKEGEGEVSQIVDNKDGSFSFAFKGPNNELQHIQIIRPEGVKGDLTMELYNAQDRRRSGRGSGGKNNECDICGKVLSSSTNLLRHKMYHSAERPFRCEICDKGFKDVSNLKKHTMIHKRIFPCHLCKKSFLRKSLLGIHLLRHQSRTAVVKTGNSMKEITLRTFVDDDGTRVEEMSMAALGGQTFEYKHRIVKADPADKDVKTEIKDEGKGLVVVDPGADSERLNDGSVKSGSHRPIFTVTTGGLQVTSFDQGTSTDDAQNVSLSATGTSNIDADDMPDLKILPVPEEFVKMYQCGHCGKRTVQRGNMMRHLIHHLKEKPFGCDECPKQFVDKGELVKHKKTHSKPYRCPQCNGAFAHNVQLVKHLQSDCLGHMEQLNYTVLEDGKTYKCDTCSIEMKRLGNMIKHVGTHRSGNRRNAVYMSKKDHCRSDKSKMGAPYYYDSVHGAFFCAFCSKSFSQKANVHRHVQMHSKEEPQHSCRYCERTFPCANSLKRHVQMHTKPFKCDQCSCSFSRQFFLDAHMKNHSEVERLEDNQDYFLLEDKSTYSCKHCDKKLYKRYRMMNHVKMHTNKRPFECPTCNKCFSSRYLQLKHKKSHAKPFVCKVCGETFTRKFFLLVHRKKMHSFQEVVMDVTGDETEENEGEAEDSFFCAICGAPFARLVIKMNHEKKCGDESKVMVRLSNGKGYKCKICNKVATLKHNLMVHIRKHNGMMLPDGSGRITVKNIEDSFVKEEPIVSEPEEPKVKPPVKRPKPSTPKKEVRKPSGKATTSVKAANVSEPISASSSRRPARTQKVPSRFLE